MGKHVNGKFLSLLAPFLCQLSPLLFCIVLWLSYPVPKNMNEMRCLSDLEELTFQW